MAYSFSANDSAGNMAQIKLQQELDEKAKAAAERPEQYKYTSQIDQGTGMLKAPYTFDPTKSEGFSALKQRATSQGPSTWANMMLGKQGMEQQGLQDQAAQSALGAQAGARSSLAMRGGLGGGARNRLAGQGQRDLLMQNQANARQGSLNRFNILGQDESTKLDLLKGVSGTELEAQKGNIGQALAERQREEAAKQNAYTENMKGWAGERQAQATEKSKGK